MAEVYLKGFGKKDIDKFQNLGKERESVIEEEPFRPIVTSYNANLLAQKLHPDFQMVKVSEIIEENQDAKSFILEPDFENGTNSLAYFRAGQYICVEVLIDGGIYKRPYTLSCSPRLSLENKYKITIKRVSNGIVSNYFLDHVHIGDSFKISAPLGEFYYSSLRDANHVVFIAGGSGITPFISMAESILDKTDDFQLTCFYGVKRKTDLLFKERLDEICKKTDKVKVVYLLSDEENQEFLHGYVTNKIIDPYLKEENSFFVCGPLEMYDYINTILKTYNLESKYIRHDIFRSEMEIKQIEKYQLTILTQDKEIKLECSSEETLLATMEKNGINALSACHVGECGFCKSKLISGKVKTFDTHLRNKDKEFNYIHPCISYPESDVVLKLPN